MKSVENERAEGEFIARQISERLKKYETPDYRDFVVLYRTNAQSRVLEEVFLRHGIPYKIVGGIKFYERKEIKDILSYLRVIQNPNDSVSLLRIINTPPRKIGLKTLEAIQRFASANDISFFQAMEEIEKLSDELPESKRQSIQDFVKLIRALQKANNEFPASGVIKHVLEYSGYKTMVDDNTAEGDARMENIHELIGVATKYNQLEPAMSLNVFLEEVALIADVDTLSSQENAVTFMTIHSAKGLEFPVVFIAGLEEGIFPHSRSLLDRDELEEERRLMYVAVTRAKDKLYLLNAQSRMLYGENRNNAPSQFIAEIPEELLEQDALALQYRQRRQILQPNFRGTAIPVETPDAFETKSSSVETGNASRENEGEIRFIPDIEEIPVFSDGDKVYHEKFGDGVIISVVGGVATVCFKNVRYGIKKLALSVAPLKKVM